MVNEDGVLPGEVSDTSGGEGSEGSDEKKQQAHRYVLMNSGLVDEYIKEFENLTKRRLRSRTRASAEIQKVVNRDFASWFSRRMMNIDGLEEVSDDIKFLARGPLDHARRYSSYNINGLRFRTMNREEGLKTQNSGVFLFAGTPSVASSRDVHGVVGDVAYYGKLIDIVELNYYGRFFVTLFKCIWANTTTSRGIRKDCFGFTEVNFSNRIHIGDSIDDEPYILPVQAQMVFYVTNELDKEWSVAIPCKPRDSFDMGGNEYNCMHEIAPFSVDKQDIIFSNDIENLCLARDKMDDEATHIVENVDDVNNMDKTG
ncbi:Unknown protein [Striga hermonthica]|uniref:DUF4216 domain-containing protein n=1 Tax=Striga hermonthica TaxID=68872 RepID=A0A9N7MQS1_STRHE|nr:Unknown protein [Striga hermonthica]